MRIALFHNLPSGGAKRAINELVRHLQQRHEIDAYTLSCADHAFADLRPYVANHFVYPFQSLPLLKSPFGRANQVSRLLDLYRIRKPLQTIARDIETRGYDVLFVQPCQIEIASSIIAYARNIPAVYFCQEPLRRAYESIPPRPYDTGGSRLRKALDAVDPLPRLYLAALRRVDRANTRRAHTVLVNSKFIQKAVDDIYGVRAVVNYLGVDLDQFRPLEHRRRRAIFSVGSLTPLKSFDFLIEAVGLLPAGQRVPLIIASNFQNPPEREYLQQMAADRDVDLQLLSNISDHRLSELYNEALVVAYAAIREPFGLVPIEAMACGAPVVAVDEGGVQESVIHEETGLITAREPARFAAALARLLADPALARAYGQQGRRHVERNWSWERAAAQLERTLTVAASDTRKINAGQGFATTSAR